MSSLLIHWFPGQPIIQPTTSAYWPYQNILILPDGDLADHSFLFPNTPPTLPLLSLLCHGLVIHYEQKYHQLVHGYVSFIHSILIQVMSHHSRWFVILIWYKIALIYLTSDTLCNYSIIGVVYNIFGECLDTKPVILVSKPINRISLFWNSILKSLSCFPPYTVDKTRELVDLEIPCPMFAIASRPALHAVLGLFRLPASIEFESGMFVIEIRYSLHKASPTSIWGGISEVPLIKADYPVNRMYYTQNQSTLRNECKLKVRRCKIYSSQKYLGAVA